MTDDHDDNFPQKSLLALIPRRSIFMALSLIILLIAILFLRKSSVPLLHGIDRALLAQPSGQAARPGVTRAAPGKP